MQYNSEELIKIYNSFCTIWCDLNDIGDYKREAKHMMVDNNVYKIPLSGDLLTVKDSPYIESDISLEFLGYEKVTRFNYLNNKANPNLNITTYRSLFRFEVPEEIYEFISATEVSVVDKFKEKKSIDQLCFCRNSLSRILFMLFHSNESDRIERYIMRYIVNLILIFNIVESNYKYLDSNFIKEMEKENDIKAIGTYVFDLMNQADPKLLTTKELRKIVKTFREEFTSNDYDPHVLTGIRDRTKEAANFLNDIVDELIENKALYYAFPYLSYI